MAELEYWICASVAIAVIIAVRWLVLSSRYYRLASKIPGPRGLPLLGNTKIHYTRREDILEYAKELCTQYGPVCSVFYGTCFCVILADAGDLSFIFNGQKALAKPIFYNAFEFVFGKTVVSAKTDDWRSIRKRIEPSFTRHIIDSYVSTFYEKSLGLVDMLKKHSGQGPFNIVDYTMKCTLSMVTETSLGVPLDVQKENSNHFIYQNFVGLSHLIYAVVTRPWLWFKHVRRFSKYCNKVAVLVKPIHRLIDNIIQMKMNLYSLSNNFHLITEKEALLPKQRLGLLDNMIREMHNKPGLMSSKQLRDETMVVMAAATDTTAYTVGYTLMMLGLHQDVQRRVMREQQDIFGEDMERPVTVADLRKMAYLEQVINETMRLYPIIPIVGRKVDEDVDIRGYTLPAGTSIYIPIYLVHRDPAYYPDPDKFDPERFSKENTASRPACAFIPFTLGRRVCIGKYYAYMSMKTMLSVVLRKYDILEYGTRVDMKCLKFELFLKMVNGHDIKLEPRGIVHI